MVKAASENPLPITARAVLQDPIPGGAEGGVSGPEGARSGGVRWEVEPPEGWNGGSGEAGGETGRGRTWGREAGAGGRGFEGTVGVASHVVWAGSWNSGRGLACGRGPGGGGRGFRLAGKPVEVGSGTRRLV